MALCFGVEVAGCGWVNVMWTACRIGASVE